MFINQCISNRYNLKERKRSEVYIMAELLSKD